MRGPVRLNTLVLAAILFAAFTIGDVADARPDVPTVEPVQILRCTINRRLGYVDPYQPVWIAFVNRRDALADDVHFTVLYAGRTAHIDDRGAFSTGIKIEHTFRAFWNVLFVGAEPTSCAVDYVHFSNGEAWASRGVENQAPPTHSPNGPRSAIVRAGGIWLDR